MTYKIYTYVLLLGLLSLSLTKISEVSVNNFDGSLYFVQVYEDNCQSCSN
jgi:hypothetical protein